MITPEKVNAMEQNNDNISFHDESLADRELNKVIHNLKSKANGTPRLAKTVAADSVAEGEENFLNLTDEQAPEQSSVDTDFDPDNDDDFVINE